MSWFDGICDGSEWSELVLDDLLWFCVMWADSVWFAIVLCDLWWFFMIWAGSEWSALVLLSKIVQRILCRFSMIGGGSMWSEPALCDLWGSVWSEMIFWDLEWFCVFFNGSLWSVMVLHCQKWLCLICDIFATMETSPSPYDPSFSSYAQITCKNGAKSLQKW